MTPGDGTFPRTVGQRATVLACLPNGMVHLQMSDGSEVRAHAARDLRMALSRLLLGDQVIVELSPFDPHKGRICNLLRSMQPSQQSELSSNPPQQRELS